MNDVENMAGMVSEKVQVRSGETFLVGLNGPNGFVAYPGETATGFTLSEWVGWMKANAFPAQERESARETAPRMSVTDLKQAQRIAEGLGLSEEASRLGRVANERMQACGDGFCDRAARESAKMNAAIGARMRAADAAAEPPGTPIGLDAFLSASENARRPCCPCFTGSVLGCMCACHRLGTATGVGTLGGYVRHGSGQQSKAPGKQFTRSDILAILKAQHTLALLETSTGEWKAAKNSAFREIISIFENLE